MAVYLNHGSAGSTGPSPILWQRADVLAAIHDPSKALHLFDDMAAFNGLLTSTTGDYTGTVGYSAYQDASDTITQLATESTGVVRIATDGTDNDESWLQVGGATGVCCKIASSGGTKLIFETRIRMDTIASRNIFVGLAEEGFAAADAITDAGAMVTTKDFIGFRSLEGDATGLDTVYQKASQTTGVVKDDAQTLVADTWYKVGFIFDPLVGNVNKAIKFFIDGVELADGIALSVLAAATFPDGEEMSPVWGVKNGTTTATKLDIDWWRLLQVRA